LRGVFHFEKLQVTANLSPVLPPCVSLKCGVALTDVFADTTEL